MPNLLSTPRDVGLTSDLAHFHFQECDLGYLKHSNLVWLLERKPCSVMTVTLSSAPSLAQLHLIHFPPHYGSCHLYFSRLMIFFFNARRQFDLLGLVEALLGGTVFSTLRRSLFNTVTAIRCIMVSHWPCARHWEISRHGSLFGNGDNLKLRQLLGMRVLLGAQELPPRRLGPRPMWPPPLLQTAAASLSPTPSSTPEPARTPVR